MRLFAISARTTLHKKKKSFLLWVKRHTRADTVEVTAKHPFTEGQRKSLKRMCVSGKRCLHSPAAFFFAREGPSKMRLRETLVKLSGKTASEPL